MVSDRSMARAGLKVSMDAGAPGVDAEVARNQKGL